MSVPVISVQGSIFSFWIWRQLHCCFGEGSSYRCFVLHSQRLWNSLRKIFWSVGAIYRFRGRQPSNNRSRFWWESCFKFGNWHRWTSLDIITLYWEIHLSFLIAATFGKHRPTNWLFFPCWLLQSICVFFPCCLLRFSFCPLFLCFFFPLFIVCFFGWGDQFWL